MEQRNLGSSGLGVSAIGLGCMGMSYHRRPAPPRQGACYPDAVERMTGI